MKCKIQRKTERKRSKAIRKVFLELEKLNPKRAFFLDGNVIFVNIYYTYELLKLNLPENCSIHNKKNLEGFGQLVIKIDPDIFIYIIGW